MYIKRWSRTGAKATAIDLNDKYEINWDSLVSNI